MVLGRTYFIPGGGRWGIPIRKTIFNGGGRPLGVMTAGLSIEGAFKLFAEELSLGEHNTVVFVRDCDGYVQYYSSLQEISKEVYDAPLPQEFLDGIVVQIGQGYGVSYEQMKESNRIFFADVLSPQGVVEQIALKYEPSYELWVVSRIDHARIEKDFFESFAVYLFVFLVTQGVLFLFFKIIATAERQRRNDLIFQATHDELTALPNRNYLKKEIGRWIYQGAPSFSLYYLDMDHFKDINDSFGHHYGDALLVEFSKRIVHVAGEESVVIRQGGDEFIILTRLKEPQEALEHAEAILREIALVYYIDELSFIVGASLDVAKYPEHGQTLDMLLRISDIAMHEAKKYKNSVRLFFPFSELKIDKSFIDTLLEDTTSQKMIQNIIAIGKNLELHILAEGVETSAQEKLLKAFGCDRFQGYLYAKPLEHEALKEFFKSCTCKEA